MDREALSLWESIKVLFSPEKWFDDDLQGRAAKGKQLTPDPKGSTKLLRISENGRIEKEGRFFVPQVGGQKPFILNYKQNRITGYMVFFDAQEAMDWKWTIKPASVPRDSLLVWAKSERHALKYWHSNSDRIQWRGASISSRPIPNRVANRWLRNEK